jgi:hypothetical protein
MAGNPAHTGGRTVLRTIGCKEQRMRTLPIRYFMVLLAFISAFTLCQNLAFGSDKFLVTIPADKLIGHLDAGKRITGYKLQTSGRIYAVLKIPLDWSVRVLQGVELLPLEAEAGHGAGWLTIEDVKLGAFEDFLIIEVHSERGVELKIKADFSVDIPMQEEKEHFTIDEKDMVMVPCP